MSCACSSGQPVGDQELGELRAGIALVDDLHARGAGRPLGNGDQDRPRRREVLRIHAEIGHRHGLVRLLLRSEEHTSELQSLMRISYAVFCLKKKKHVTKYLKP